MTPKQIEYLNVSRLLIMVYNCLGRPCGVKTELKISKKTGQEYEVLKGQTFQHTAHGKAILKELARIQGVDGQIQEWTWRFFQTCLQEGKKRFWRNVWNVRENLPLIAAELGGMGQFRITAILQAKKLLALPEKRILINGIGHGHSLVADKEKQNVHCAMCGFAISVHNLVDVTNYKEIEQHEEITCNRD